ncbi:MAG TPA: YdeI/OmpD-associated family protein [Chloroflexota bacterium]|jgi:uncharacterized protein YdeI (YjbR/CyaY-like superfamily)|nr:YdeI/OmpD-associated family protein [Chloroflexota bacterium]
MTPSAPKFFKNPADFRKWLEKNHDKKDELLVGLYKKGSGKPSIDWPQLVEEVLCFGWIDGVRRSLDDERYVNRITPRRKGSNWSAINIAKVQELIAQGRMHPAGLAAFEARKTDKGAPYSYENRDQAKLDAAAERKLKANQAAWEFFQSRPPWYRRTATFWVVSAKREETRQRRLEQLIADSAAGRLIGLVPASRQAGSAKGSSKGGR